MSNSLPQDYRNFPNTPLSALKHIPGNEGWPALGILPGLLRDFYSTFERHQQRYGLTSRVRMGAQPGILALGPDNAEQILRDPDKNFSSRMGYANVFKDWFGYPILLRDFDEHRLHRRGFQTAFKAEAMQGYAEDINRIISATLATWPDQQPLLFVPFIKQLLIIISAKVFYGIEDPGGATRKLADAFLQIFDRGMMSLVRMNVPPFKYYYGQKGKTYVRNYLHSLIEPRRNQDGNDFMSFFIRESRDDDLNFSDEELIDDLSFLFFAAFDTTASGLSHLMMYLAQYPDAQEQLRQESMSFESDDVAFGELKQLQTIEHAFSEALRLHPSVSVLMRRNINECILEGVTVPANTLLFVIPGFNHRMPQYWSRPDQFDFQRFNPERQEQKNHNYSFLPFGAGAHKCIGMNFAIMNARIFLHHLLRNFRFTFKSGYQPHSHTLPTPRPSSNLPLVVERL